MTISKRSLILWIFFLTLAGGLGIRLISLSAARPIFEFEQQIIDAQMAGDCKMLADIDGDGLIDLVVGGSRSEGLAWYKNPNWEKTVIAYPVVEFSTDGAAGDIDGDGDIDIVIGDGGGNGNLVMYLNPGNLQPPSGDKTWIRAPIGSVGAKDTKGLSFVKDIELADFNLDARLDIAARSRQDLKLYMAVPGGAWQRVDLAVRDLDGEGLSASDLDQDGDIDLILGGAWLRNDSGRDQQNTTSWTEMAIGPAPDRFKAVASDLDGNGSADIVYSNSEGSSDVLIYFSYWESNNVTWKQSKLAVDLEKAHSLQSADFDNDGDNDLLIAQMHTSDKRAILLFENRLDSSDSWALHQIGNNGLHNALVSDIDRDGDFDVFGSNWTGNPPVRILWNTSPRLASDWAYIEISDTHKRTFGLSSADVDNDGDMDILSGRFMYLQHNQGIHFPWTSRQISQQINYFELWPAGDKRLGLLGSRYDGDLQLYLGYSDEILQGRSEPCFIGSIAAASHKLGSQGSLLADLGPDIGRSLLVSTGLGVYVVRPTGGSLCDKWDARLVAATRSDEGIDVADMDGDGLLDLVASTGSDKKVAWFRNPGNVEEKWTAFEIGEMPEFVFPDRLVARDLNGDDYPDVVVSEENGRASGARTIWWASRNSSDWDRRLLAIQGSTNSLSADDMDNDGDIDLVTIEHRGELRTIVWCNIDGAEFSPFQVSRGNEAHLGAALWDIDSDGDLDIINIGFDRPNTLWMLENPGFLKCPK